MEVKVKARYVRIGPKKLRMIRELVLGKNIDEAVSILKNLPKKGARILEKVIKSASDAAKYKGEGYEWKVKNVIIDGGPMLKRWRAATMGRGVMIRKRTSHITVIIESKEGE
jgi:large subunit ribosomal protein L22